MYTINKKDSENVSAITITDYIDPEGYCPKVVFSVTYSDKGFHVHFDVYEKNPRAVHTHNFDPIYEDSCVEWFINFDPEHTDRYFNIEINANGCVDVAFRKDRFVKTDLTEQDAQMLGIKVQFFDDRWTVDYTVPFELIKRYFTEYEFNKGQKFISNVYKCGDETEYPHFGCWKMVDLVEQEFHSPAHFGTMIVG